MRTWRQGVVGKLTLPNSKTLYIKCLKYPLAILYEGYDFGTLKLEHELFKAFLQLDVLKHIERIGLVKLTTDEVKLGDLYNIHHFTGTTGISKVELDEKMKSLLLNRGKPCSVGDIQLGRH